MYQKEIIYMSLFDNQIKDRCVGYLKLEKKQENYQLELQVKNVPDGNNGIYAIRLQNETGWQEEGTLLIKDGNGRWTGSVKDPIWRAEIILSDSRRIKGESRNAPSAKEAVIEAQLESQPEPQVRMNKNVPKAEPQPAMEEMREALSVKPSVQTEEQKRPPELSGEAPLKNELPKSEPAMSEPPKIEALPSRSQEETVRPKQEAAIISLERASAPRPIVRTKKTGKPENMPLYENKWEQLLNSYERIHPYGDSRVYVKLAPKDFVILRENYQHLVNNSFLLHGFYNYRYLILGKEKDFYLGVPGVYYEREKMVALMFGFEAFECEGGEADEGKFGYYLRRVEI